MLRDTSVKIVGIFATKSATKRWSLSVFPSQTVARYVFLQSYGEASNYERRKVTRIRLNIEYLIVSRHSRISVQIGAATVATCFPSVARTRKNAANAVLHATRHAHISFLISVG